MGPESESARYYLQCEAGEGRHHALFVRALARPDRDELWLEGQRMAMSPTDFNREYPTSAAQALEAAGECFFSAEDLEQVGRYARGFQPFEQGRLYAAGVDVGFKDASVITVLDHTDGVLQVVAFVYLKPSDPVRVQRAVEKVASDYPTCHILIEDNGPGYALRANLGISSHRVAGFSTSAVSKSRILSQLQHSLARREIAWNPEQVPELHREMFGYRLPDTNITQDTVLSLAIAVEAVIQHRQEYTSRGRVLGIIHV